MASQTPPFEPSVVEAFIERLYRKASAVIVGCVATGVVLGAFIGATPLTSLSGLPVPSQFGYATLLVGCFVGGFVGYTIGETRSSIYRLQAQMALCDLETAKKVDRLVAFFFPATQAPAPLLPQTAAPALVALVPEPTAAPEPQPVAAPPAPEPVVPAPPPEPVVFAPAAVAAPEPQPAAAPPAPEPVAPIAPVAAAARPLPPLVATVPLREEPVTPPLSA